MHEPDQFDMFGHTPSQSEMFEACPVVGKPIHSEKYGVIEPPPPGGHTPETIRAKMLKLIAEAKASNVVPWPLRQTRTHMVMFPYMAEWLPDEEGEQLLLEFMHEMERLGHKEPPPLAA
jgi:hypothetical protein